MTTHAGTEHVPPPDAAPAEESAPQRSSLRPHLAVRIVVSGWLVFHLSAIAVAPASVEPSSELIRSGWRLCRPYLQALYLNHGYHFFAPEPEASSLLAFHVESPSGTQATFRIPDRRTRPRLLYHRHFMLAEQLRTVPPELQREWIAALAAHAARESTGGSEPARVGVSRIAHFLPTMEMVREGVPLDNPASYAEEPLGLYEVGGEP